MAEPKMDAEGRPFLTLELPEAEVVFYPTLFPAADANRLFEQVIMTTEWRQDAMKMFGTLRPLPRLTAWYGDPGVWRQLEFPVDDHYLSRTHQPVVIRSPRELDGSSWPAPRDSSARSIPRSRSDAPAGRSPPLSSSRP